MSDNRQNARSKNEDEEQHDIDSLREGDTVTAELEGKVVDEMDRHDDLIRIDVEGQKVEIVSDEIVEIEQPARAVDIEEVDDAE